MGSGCLVCVKCTVHVWCLRRVDEYKIQSMQVWSQGHTYEQRWIHGFVGVGVSLSSAIPRVYGTVGREETQKVKLEKFDLEGWSSSSLEGDSRLPPRRVPTPLSTTAPGPLPHRVHRSRSPADTPGPLPRAERWGEDNGGKTE